MNTKTTSLILSIIGTVLSLAGLVLIILQIASDNKSNTLLCIAFSAVILSNICNLIRLRINKKDK